MWNWFKRKLARWTTIGELTVESGTILLADPMYLDYRPVVLEGIPPGRYPLQAQIRRYPGWGERITHIQLNFRPGAADARRTLGTIAVDSATVVALDTRTYELYLKRFEPKEVGRTRTPNHHHRVAVVIGQKFGLQFREADRLHSEFLQPISEELETQILAHLKTFPEYAVNTSIYFQVDRQTACEQFLDRLDPDRLWNKVVIDESTGASCVAFLSGFGDGVYPVDGIYDADVLQGVEIQFIGPAQVEIAGKFRAQEK